MEQRDNLGRSLSEQIVDAQADYLIAPDDDGFVCKRCGEVQSVYWAEDERYELCNDCFN